MKSELFRSEVFNVRSNSSFSSITLVHPLSHTVITLGAALMLSALIAVLTFGEYTRHVTVPGIIEPTSGVLKIYASQLGIATGILVRDGEKVQRGQILVQARPERRNGQGKDVLQEMDVRAKDRLSMLRQELATTINMHNQEATNNREILNTLLRSRAILLDQLQAQARRVEMAEAALRQHQELRKSGYISQLQLSQNETELLDQKARSEALQREIVAADGEIIRYKSEQKTLGLKRKVTETQFERNIATVQGEISQLVGEQAWSIVAPSDGTITAVSIAAGQTATIGTPLVSIMPSNATLRAKLYAPSSALGFVHVGTPVKLRLDAFPYQKFGFAVGRVLSIAEAPTAMSEFATNTTLMPKMVQSQEPMFGILVELEQDYVTAYGKRERLRAGLQLAGDLQLGRRRLYEWLLEPLFSISGR